MILKSNAVTFGVRQKAMAIMEEKGHIGGRKETINVRL